MNFLLFTKDLSEVFIQERQCLLESESNRLTAFWLDISEFTSYSLSDIEITLKGHTDINFKTHVESGEFFTIGNNLYFKNSKVFTSISGEYYLEITDGTTIWYSNMILFNSDYNLNLTSDFFLLHVTSGSFSMSLVGSGDVYIDFGDGDSATVTLPATVTHTFTDTSIIRISSAYRITSFTCNDSQLYKVENEENLLSCTTINVSSSSLSNFGFYKLSTLTNVNISNTTIFTGSNCQNFGINNIEVFRADNIDGLNQQVITTEFASLKELYISDTNMSSVSYLTQAYDGMQLLEIIDLHSNLLVQVPRLGLSNVGVLISPIEQYIVSNNNIRASSDYTYLKPFLQYTTEKIDLKNNSIPQNLIDLILEDVAELNINLDGLYLDVSGTSPISGITMGIPTDKIRIYEILDGGRNYQVNDVLTITDGDEYGTGAYGIVSSVDSNGTITGFTFVSNGSGYNQVQNFTGGSGTDGDIQFFSPRVYLEQHGVELYTNATTVIDILPDNAILDATSKKYLKDSEGNYITW